jgi:hypothetical protein
MHFCCYWLLSKNVAINLDKKKDSVLDYFFWIKCHTSEEEAHGAAVDDVPVQLI